MWDMALESVVGGYRLMGSSRPSLVNVDKLLGCPLAGVDSGVWL